MFGGGVGAFLLALTATACSDANPAFFHHEVAELRQDPWELAVGTAGHPLEEVPSIRARDESGNPVPGVEVAFHVEKGEGSVQPDTAVTDREGRARPDAWVLGENVGENVLVADMGAFGEARFEAEGREGPPERLIPLSAQTQEGRVSRPVVEPPAVRVEDAFENPVADVEVSFVVHEGDSEVTEEAAVSDAEGTVAVQEWRMGASEGVTRVRAQAEGTEAVFFEARALEPEVGGPGLAVDGVHLNQGNQSEDGSVGGVAGRPGLLRVILSAEESNDLAPEVMVRLLAQGQVREERIAAPSNSVPMDPDPTNPDHTWDLPLSAEEVREGLAVEVVVDPDSTIPGDRFGFRYPLGDQPRPLDVRPLPPLNIAFVPIHWEATGLTGGIDSSNRDDFLERTQQWIPSAEVSAEIHTPFTTDRNLTQTSGWVGLLSDLQALRVDSGAQDEYYHGVVSRTRSIPVAGMAYLLGSPESRNRVALTHDGLPRASWVMAHELGHNMGRRHAPCGGPERVDAHYPYEGAEVGPPGYDVRSGELVSTTRRYDYMSYCTPGWTSDYTYEAILDWRRDDPLAADAVGTMAGTPAGTGEERPALLVWGMLGPGMAVLNPAFSVNTVPRLPEESGPHRLRGFDEEGVELFSLSFRGERPSEGAHEELRHFAFAIPLDEDEQEDLARIELQGDGGSTERRQDRAPAPRRDAAGVPLSGPEVRMASEGGELRVSWDTDRHEAILLRDSETGRIRGISRSGSLALPEVGGQGADPGAGDGRVEVHVSDGVTSRRWSPDPWEP